jgi:sorting nexin-1/2
LQWFDNKLQEVESEELQLRKLHAVVDSLVNHRKGEIHRKKRCLF